MKRLTRAAIIAASVLFTQDATAADILLTGKWLVEDIDGGGVVDRLQTFLDFDEDGAVSGSGGCNRFAGRANISGQSISFGEVAATSMMCPPASMDQEAKFFAALEKSAE